MTSLTVVLTGVLVCMTSSSVTCLSLPPVYWNSSNPMFKTSNNDHIVEVNIGDTIDFVCPHYNPGTDIRHMEYYTIYLVSRWEYEHCSFSPDVSATLIVNCTSPRQKRRFTIWFDEFAAIPNVPEFKPGETYYFITTSAGDREGMMNVYQGACYYRNMKLQVHVCCRPTSSHTDQNEKAEPDLIDSPEAANRTNDITKYLTNSIVRQASDRQSKEGGGGHVARVTVKDVDLDETPSDAPQPQGQGHRWHGSDAQKSTRQGQGRSKSNRKQQQQHNKDSSQGHKKASHDVGQGQDQQGHRHNDTQTYNAITNHVKGEHYKDSDAKSRDSNALLPTAAEEEEMYILQEYFRSSGNSRTVTWWWTWTCVATAACIYRRVT